MSGTELTAVQRQRVRRIVEPLLPVLLRTAQCLTRRNHDAEDLVQETLIKAMRAIDQFEDGTDAKAWLLTIMRRAHVDALRRAGRRIQALSLDAGDGVEAVADEPHDAGRFDADWSDPAGLMQQFEDQQVIDALKALPQDLCWTLLLVDVEGLPLAAAAQVLGVAEGTVKSRSHRGRAALRDRLFLHARENGWLRMGSTHES